MWLDERPARWGGSWALGCSVCAEFDHRQRTGASRPCDGMAPRKTRGYAGTKFARYEVRHPALGATHVREHALTDHHRLAVSAHLAPDKPVSILLQRNMEDDRLLSGAVPQPADWLRAWRLCMNPASWSAAADNAQTEHFIAQIRQRSVQPRAFQSMVSCMQEALRARKRAWLQEAAAIFLGFDDKNGRKLLRFKCDTRDAPACLDAAGGGKADPSRLPYGARIGVVGCMPVGLASDMADHERDYAERTSEGVVKLLERLCTPRCEALDHRFFDAVLDKVVGIVVDGALLKTAQYMKADRFRNIVIIMRDPAHIIRTTCRDPLHDADIFSQQYDRLFGQRHAVLTYFMFSNIWQDQLEACQRQLQAVGASTPSLKSVLRHLSFVQPRFESFVSPRRRYVCLLRAIAMVLASKAGDVRLDPAVQRRAEEALQEMSKSEDCFVAGLAGDYGEVCLEFLRRFDVHDHDPACTAKEVETFLSTLRRLFIQGYVLCDTSGPCSDAGLGQKKTLTQIAIENMEEPLVLAYLASQTPHAIAHGLSVNRPVSTCFPFLRTLPAGMAHVRGACGAQEFTGLSARGRWPRLQGSPRMCLTGSRPSSTRRICTWPTGCLTRTLCQKSSRLRRLMHCAGMLRHRSCVRPWACDTTDAHGSPPRRSRLP